MPDARAVRLERFTEGQAREVCSWRYSPPYDCYDGDSADVDLLCQVDPAGWGYYAAISEADDAAEDRRLVGFCCFGTDAQVPGQTLALGVVDIGLGVHSSLLDHGWGTAILDLALTWATETWRPAAFRAAVAGFNARSQRMLTRAGFHVARRFDSVGREFVELVRDFGCGEDERPAHSGYLASELTTELPDVVLRPLASSDAIALYALVRASAGHLTRHGDYEELVALSAEDLVSAIRAEAGYGIFAKGVLVGYASLNERDPGKFVLGYWLGAAATGNGYATAACRALVESARRLGATDVFAGVTKGNGESERVLERTGLRALTDMGTYTRFHMPLGESAE